MKFKFLLVFFPLSCAHKNQSTNNQVTLISQWHLQPMTNTIDINAATNLPQYKNQKEIFKFTQNLINSNATKIILAEGCDTGKDITEDFEPAFNGWSMNSLIANISNPKFDDIMTAIPMKLKAYYGNKIKVLCADSDDLIKKSQLALSDARAFSGFYMRLKEYKKTKHKSYQSYLEALTKMHPEAKSDPLQFCKDRTLLALDNFSKITQERNEIFVKNILENQIYNPVLIVGAIHINDLNQRLEKNGAPVKIVNLSDEKNNGNSDSFISEIKKLLD